MVLVNQTFVRRYGASGEIVGHSVKIPKLQSAQPNRLAAPGVDGWMQVIGVVEDSVNDGIDQPLQPAIYVPYSMQLWTSTQVLVRTRGAPDAIANSLRKQIATVNPEQQTYGAITDLEKWIEDEPVWGRGRLISALFAGFSILALALSAVGLYSVVSYAVAQRTSEFGIRMALGATRSHVVRVTMASAVSSVGWGFVAGLALSFGLHRMLAGLVGTTGIHGLMVAEVSLLLLAVAGLACLVPARKALAVDPMTALRSE
jgi:predicted lysophospholipase L1 biosynthesis ABC-type transport system permease subunit